MKSDINSYNYESKDYLHKLNQKNNLWYNDILQEVLKCQPARVLELGCGSGDFAKLLQKNGVADITALDNSLTFLKHATTEDSEKKSIEKKMHFKKTDLEKTDEVVKVLKEKSYPVVASIDCIEHLRHRRELLTAVTQHLPKGGHLVLQCPNLYCNLIGTNYKLTPLNIWIKLYRGIRGYFIYQWALLLGGEKEFPLLEVGVNYNLKKYLDYLIADEDAVVLLNSFWLLLFFKRHGLKITKFTTLSFPTRSVWLKRILNFCSKIPFICHLGGKIILVGQKGTSKNLNVKILRL